MKLKLKLDDQETRAVWATVQRAKDEVAGWPAWKRGEASGAMTTRMDSAATDPEPSSSTAPTKR